MKKKIMILVLTVFAVGCPEKEVHQTIEVVRPIKMLSIEAGFSGGKLEYPAEVSASQESELSFEVPGRITKLSVKEGQNVKKGDVIAELDATDARAQLSSVNARLRADKAEYDRYKQLYATQAASLQDLDVKRKAYEVTRAQAVQARKAVTDTRIVAPFAGKISRKLVDQFQNVQAKQGVVLLQDLSGLEVKVNIPERDWARASRVLNNPEFLKEADVDILITSIPDQTFKGEIKEVATAANPTTRTFQVTLSFDPPDDVTILPGMTARVTADAPESIVQQASLTIPVRALVAANEGAKPSVWVVNREAMTVSQKNIELGDVDADVVEVKGGLEDGQTIAISGVQKLREGMKVTEFKLADLKK